MNLIWDMFTSTKLAVVINMLKIKTFFNHLDIQIESLIS